MSTGKQEVFDSTHDFTTISRQWVPASWPLGSGWDLPASSRPLQVAGHGVQYAYTRICRTGENTYVVIGEPAGVGSEEAHEPSVERLSFSSQI